MSVVEHSFYDAVLADIVYINIAGEVTGKPGFTKGLTGFNLAKLIEPELTEPLAAEIGERFIVLDVKNDPYCLSLLKHYRSLMPMAMEVRKPIFFLKSADGAIGAHIEAVRKCYKDFEALAGRIAGCCGVAFPKENI